jgi:hypothetical protein
MGGRDNTGGKAGAAGTGGKGGTGGASGAGGGSGTGGAGGKSGAGGAGGKSGAGGAGGRSGAGGTGGMDSKPTCGAWKDSGVATDGARVIDPDGTGPIRPFSVYCAGMASATPREYLDLPHNANAGFPGMNVSVYVDVMDDACPCGALELRFTKVRIRPADLVIVATDTTFATFNADATCLTSNEVCQGPLFVYATAMDCRGLSAVFGSAEVDFGETPFHIANSAAFAGVGWMPHGSVTYSSDRKRASLTGGGFCGGFTPSGGELPLTQD